MTPPDSRDASSPPARWSAAPLARIAREPCDQHYGCRDFDVLDSSGYRLCFGHDTGCD